MMKKTKDYDMFIFRDDNRSAINQNHVCRLVESVKTRNLLEFRPISVNEKHEVLDGQHRLLAAKFLKTDIYYQVNTDLKSEDMIHMNVSKSWSSVDYLNYYCKNGYKEYQKLEIFTKNNNISLKVALNITLGSGKLDYNKYKLGKYVFVDDVFGESLDVCWDTIGYIKKMNGYSPYTTSARFWKSLLKLIKHPDFDPIKWKLNMSRMVERFGARARIEDYYKMMMDIYNWRNPLRIDLLDKFE